MKQQDFLEYVAKFGDFYTRSMFGGTGLFERDAMFALINGEGIFIRGGGKLDQQLLRLKCKKFRHVKKQTTATVNYYDVTELFVQNSSELDDLLLNCRRLSVSHRAMKRSTANRRLRDLPNMQLTLERMVKKAGVGDVETFLELGAPAVYSKVKQAYGNDIDVKLLWKFAGAVDGVHWKLIQEPKKRQLLDNCN